MTKVLSDGIYESITANVPNVTGVPGKQYYYKNDSGGTLTVTFGGVTESLDDGELLILMYDGENWTNLTPRGIQGEQGIQGEVGPQGIQGIQGEVGPVGSIENVPIGTILMFDANTPTTIDGVIVNSGIAGEWVDNITMEGWYACVNGNQAKGCPNLTDRFIMGKLITGGGSYGGSNSHIITEAQMPRHSHSGSSDDDTHTHTNTVHSANAAHGHGISGGAMSGSIKYAHASGLNPVAGGAHSISSAYTSDKSIGDDGGGVYHHTSTFSLSTSVISGNATHSHTTDIYSSTHNHTITVGATGSGESYDSRPAYYKVIYIRKCS